MRVDEVERDPSGLIRTASGLVDEGDARAAIELLTRANREGRCADIEQALVAVRRAAGATLTPGAAHGREPIAPLAGDGGVVEVDRAELSLASLRDGLARSGCLLVRGLVDHGTAARLAAGIDAALDGYDAAMAGDRCDPAWFSPQPMPDRIGGGLPEDVNRRFLRERGGVWTTDSPRMLFELFEVVDSCGLGELMTEFLGERPVLSANKCTLRRVPPDLVVDNGWHQDGAFLGEQIGALNLWLALSDCGQDAPGLDLVPRRVPHVLPSDERSKFDWSLSHAVVHDAAGETPIARPLFRSGDALLFDQLLVHQTATAREMVRPRYAIEAWFFGPSAYPEGQVPVLY